MTFVCLAIYAMVSPAREFEQPGPRESPGSARDTQIVVLAKLSIQILPGIVLTLGSISKFLLVVQRLSEEVLE